MSGRVEIIQPKGWQMIGGEKVPARSPNDHIMLDGHMVGHVERVPDARVVFTRQLSTDDEVFLVHREVCVLRDKAYGFETDPKVKPVIPDMRLRKAFAQLAEHKRQQAREDAGTQPELTEDEQTAEEAEKMGGE